MIIAGNTDDTSDDQRLAVSLGIPVLPAKFVMDQIIQEGKTLKRKEEFDGNNAARRSKRQRMFGDLPVGTPAVVVLSPGCFYLSDAIFVGFLALSCSVGRCRSKLSRAPCLILPHSPFRFALPRTSAYQN